jgi:hypothetical protein
MLAGLFKSAVADVGCGIGLGLIMLAPLCLGVDSTNIKPIYDAINAPALWAAHKWIFELQLPPQREIAWGLVPAVMIFVQWALVGFVLGSLFLPGTRTRPNGMNDRTPKT